MSIAAYVPAPYERRVREGPKPYAGFCVFRDQPPGTRSVASTAKAISKSAKLAYHWSATHDWLARAAAWDREQDRIALQARKDEIERINRMHINIAEQMLQSVEQCLPAAAAQLARSPRPRSRNGYRLPPRSSGTLRASQSLTGVWSWPATRTPPCSTRSQTSWPTCRPS